MCIAGRVDVWIGRIGLGMGLDHGEGGMQTDFGWW